ncbi:hypothetical protein BDN70DRAFT_934033 [Pholiota conissans]|uniref:Kelch repeat-containing protein n=1 Tax=Pholiota conissans TaxID=109636 RepID=A0A9P5YYY0_9AGAR|nr:hypothetical protein BDN70DRAFT_934033 [Pholiota conissans]
MGPNGKPSMSTPKRLAMPIKQKTRLAHKAHAQKSEKIDSKDDGDGSANSPVKDASGTFPPYNNHFVLLQDHFNKKLYSIGGSRCDDKGNNPTSDFCVCDISAGMIWTDLTAPFSRVERNRSKKGLPPISFPGVALFRMDENSYIVMFGGCDADEKRPRSEMVIIDLDNLEWWQMQIEGSVAPRIDPAMVTIDNSIYVFSGYRQSGGSSQALQSYSVAECDLESGIWRWTTRDCPYSALVPVGQAFQEAFSIYNGTKILLTSGRTTANSKEAISFKPKNTFFFHAKNKKFEVATADISGSLPQKVRWYHIYRPLTPESTSDSSVIICGLINVPGTNDVAPEVNYGISF